MNLELLLLSIVGVWLILLSAAVYYLYRFLNKLTKGVEGKSLQKVLEQILSTQRLSRKEVLSLRAEISRLEKRGKKHVQKVGLLRFNPFRETGGDHSFSIVMLDGEDTGYVLTGLHTRERTRIYLKQINNGVSDVKLSVDEKKALTKATKAS